jgi:AraC family transcriptional regulator of adaptative response/methylated-DNA-[protein]-cysteine methyltransferase
MPATYTHAHRIEEACRALENLDPAPGIPELAARAGLSTRHFRRLFRDLVGIPPARYAAACRASRLKAELRRTGDVTAAMLTAGYGSTARAYAAAPTRLGMTPTRYRAGGAGTCIRYTTAPCLLGAVGIGVTDRGIAAIELADTPEEAAARVRARFPRADHQLAEGELAETVARVVSRVDAPGSPVELPLDIRGTAFQESVWRALQAIPPGETRTYGEIALAIGRPGASRAVGRAVGANRHAVAVPCHRAVPADGTLGQYHWGSRRKRALLDRESADDGAGHDG